MNEDTVVMLVSIVADRKIAAIKVVRDLSGLGLKDAKDIVEQVVAGTPYMITNATHPARAAEIAALFAGCGEVTYRRRV